MNSVNYTTFDMGLAAALITKDFVLLDMDKSNPKKVQFIFDVDADDADLKVKIHQYWGNSLEASCLALFNNTKMLKSRIYSS